MLVARAGCVYSAQELSYYEGNQDWHIHREYNRSMPPIVYISRGLISDKAVTPPSYNTKPKDRVLRDKTNVVHCVTPPKKNNCAGKSKDTLATGTSHSPRKRQK